MRTVAISDLSFCEQYRSSRVQGGLSVYVPRITAKVDTVTASDIKVALLVTPKGAVGAFAAAGAAAGAGAGSVGGTPVLSVQATVAVGVG